MIKAGLEIVHSQPTRSYITPPNSGPMHDLQTNRWWRIVSIVMAHFWEWKNYKILLRLLPEAVAGLGEARHLAVRRDVVRQSTLSEKLKANVHVWWNSAPMNIHFCAYRWNSQQTKVCILRNFLWWRTWTLKPHLLGARHNQRESDDTRGQADAQQEEWRQKCL